MSRGVHRASGTRRNERFTAVEELACYFDTDAEPCNIHLEIRIPGQLDYAAFRTAAIAALADQPRASSRRARHGALSRGYEWERPGQLDIDPVSITTYADPGELAAIRNNFLARAPSIDRAPAAWLLVATGPDGDYVILNAHHATMDGMSWMAVLRDISQRYRAALGLTPVGAARVAGVRVATKAAEPGGPAGPELAAAPTGQIPARRRPPARIAGQRGGGRGCGLHLASLPGVPAVRAFADGSKATLNEALIAALIATIGRWNAEHGRPARPVRITTPVNARKPHQQQAIGNFARLVTISAVPPEPTHDLEPLLREVVRQARASRLTAGPQLDAASRGLAATWCPVAVKRLAVRAALRTVAPLTVDTVMLTNLGNVPDAPDFGSPGAIRMAVSGPAQLPRGMSVGIMTAGGQPQIGVRYNRARLDAAAAARMTGMLMRTLDEITSGPTWADRGPAPASAVTGQDPAARPHGRR